MSKEKWLITGGCGFIGTNLVNHLLKKDVNTNIRVLDNLSVGTKKDLQDVNIFKECLLGNIKDNISGVQFVEADIREYDACLKACAGIDAVIHLAANTGVAPSVENPRKDMEVNVIGTLNMLEASRQQGVDKFIYASSGAPLGEVDPPINEEKAPKPVSPYGASKLAGEAYNSVYYRTYGVNTVSLRFGNVYGPRSRNKDSVIAKFIKQALNGESLEIYGDGNQTRDFIFIDDLINAIVLSLKTNIGGEVFQIATYKETTVNEIASKIKMIVEEDTENLVNIIFGKPRTGDMKRNYSDITKARSILGFEPEYDLFTGLKKTFEYFQSLIIASSGN